MPLGLCNAPVTFMTVINDIFRPFLDDFVIVYLDDILVLSKTWKENVKHVKQVLEVLKREQLFIKMSKCEFGKTTLVYFGYIVGGGHLKIDPAKVELLKKWRRPSNVIKVRSFIGAIQYWRKFITNFSLLHLLYML